MGAATNQRLAIQKALSLAASLDAELSRLYDTENGLSEDTKIALASIQPVNGNWVHFSSALESVIKALTKQATLLDPDMPYDIDYRPIYRELMWAHNDHGGFTAKDNSMTCACGYHVSEIGDRPVLLASDTEGRATAYLTVDATGILRADASLRQALKGIGWVK